MRTLAWIPAVVAVAVSAGACGRLGFDGTGDAGGDGATGDAATCPGTDLMNDGENCGACGHSCLGGACELGVCQPRLIAEGQGSSRGIVVEGGFVYWTAAGAIRRADTVGFMVETVATYGGTGFRMIGHAGYLYWVTRDTGLVARASMTAAAPAETIATGQGDVGGVATDGINVYWDTYPTAGNIFHGTINGAPPEPLLEQPLDNLTGMQLVGATLYFIQKGVGLRALLLEPGMVETVTPGVGTWELAIDGDKVFLANLAADRVVYTTVAGDAQAELGVAMDPWGIAVDDGHVYYANELGDTIARVPRAGGIVEILATAQRPVGIAVDSKAIYWTTYTGAVFALARPLGM